MADWALQDAKNKFSALVRAALEGGTQRVTRRGEPKVVVLVKDEYDRLRRIENADAPTLGELLAQIPQDDQEIERLKLTPRSSSPKNVPNWHRCPVRPEAT